MKLCKFLFLVLFIGGSVLLFSQRTRALQEGGEPKLLPDTNALTAGRMPTIAAAGDYVVIAWNDLGMHCISPKFDQMAILPPFNNLMAQVIKRGDPPQIVTTGISLEYSIPKNKSVVGKTNFWQYAGALFGTNLPLGIGLTGNGLAGQLAPSGDHFEATGIPVLPLDDKLKWNPYQLALVRLKDAFGSVLTTANVVLPVSDEMHCDKCHSAGGPGAPGINTGSVESNILTLHDNREGTQLMSSRPVLCASCHSDNALGTPGVAGVDSMSLAMHEKHGSLRSSSRPACYDCHPGARTQCNRSAIEEMGPEGSNPGCERCHGSLSQVAASIRNGRQPWRQEPSCTNCHDQAFSTGANLYRNSRGHGGVFCSACHNSPHAWYPSRNSADNKQPLALQGSPNAIGNCSVCHTNNPGGENPHEIGGGGEHSDAVLLRRN